MPRVGWSVGGVTEEYPAKVVLLGLVGLGIPVPGVAGEVLVVASLVQSRISLRPRLRAWSSAMASNRADPVALGGGQDGYVVRQQIARPGDEDGEAGDLAVLNGSPCLPVAYRLRVAGGYRGRVPAGSRDVLLVSGGRDRAQRIDVAGVGTADHRHSRSIVSPDGAPVPAAGRSIVPDEGSIRSWARAASCPSLRRAQVCWSTARALLRSSVAITIFTRPNVV
jgi:hypothetical protein